MTAIEFANGINRCYDYSKKPGQLSLVTKFAQSVPEDRLKKLFDMVTNIITTEFNQVADIARVKKIYSEMCASMQFKKLPPSKAKQIVQLDEEGKREIEEVLYNLKVKMGVRHET